MVLRMLKTEAWLFVIGLTLLTATACNQSPVRPDAVSTPTGVGSAAVRLPGSDHGGSALTTDMTGAEEAPGPGDPDGTGTAVITLNHGQGEVCFELTVENIAPATAAHIHVAPPGVPGPVVVGLTAPTDGSSSGCVSVARELIKAIADAPDAYYINVHNAAFPAGAVRGQLSK
jgi:hypothetical protein